MSETVIRTAGIEDVETLVLFAHRLSEAEGNPPPRFDAEICRRDGFGPRPRFEALIAEIDGRPAGYALHHRSYDTDRVVRAVQLADLYVESWARGQGLGHRLARAVAKGAAAAGVVAMHWSVLRRNAGARAFYRRFAQEDDKLRHCNLAGKALLELARRVPSSSATLRPAERKDASALSGLIDRLLLAVGEEGLGFDASPRLAADGFGPEPWFRALLAEETGAIRGYALFWPNYSTDDGGPVLFLSDLLVDEAARGSGLALDLMAAVAREALAGGHVAVQWDVLEDNARARAFYQRFAAESDQELSVICAGEDFQRLIAG